MWFDVSAALQIVVAGRGDAMPVTEYPIKVAEIAEVAEVPTQIPASKPDGGKNHSHTDAALFLDFLTLNGTSTYGAVATALAWGVTRAWQAEAHLHAAGLIIVTDTGRSTIKPFHKKELHR